MPNALERSKPRWLIELALCTVVAIWSGNYVVTKLALQGWDPMVFNAARCILAALLMIAVIRGTARGAWLPGRHWRSLMVSGMGWNAVYQLLFIQAIARTTASNAALILATTPIWVGVWQQWVGREQLSPLHWGGVGISFIGVALVLFGRGLSFGAETLTGDVLALLSAVAFAGYTIHVREIQGPSSLWASGWAMGFTALAITVVGIPFVADQVRSPPSAFSWLAVIYSGVLSLAASYWMLTWAVKQIGSAHASAYINLLPMSSAGVAWLVLGERWITTQWIGAIMVIGGIWLVRRGEDDPQDPPSASLPRLQSG